MQDFFTRTTFDEAIVNQLISSQTEESIHLDFKSAGSLEKADKKKAEIGKDVSSFANSDGGIIIYGMNESNHVADSLSYIDGNNITKEWLEQIIQTNISPRINGLEIYPVRFGQRMDQTVYVVKIPASSLSPHMASDKRYYRRYNFESVPMEDYEVRNLFQRVHRADLEIMDIIVENGGIGLQAGSPTSISLKVGFQVKNISNSIEHNYKLEIHVPKDILQQHRSQAQDNFLRTEDSYSVYSFSSASPLFQNELTTIKVLHIDGSTQNYKSLKLPIIAKLYYSNGIKERSFSLEPHLKYGHKPLSEWGWR